MNSIFVVYYRLYTFIHFTVCSSGQQGASVLAPPVVKTGRQWTESVANRWEMAARGEEHKQFLSAVSSFNSSSTSWNKMSSCSEQLVSAMLEEFMLTAVTEICQRLKVKRDEKTEVS